MKVNFPFNTPKQIIRGIQIERSIKSGQPYKYMQKIKNHNPCRYGQSGYGFSYKNPNVFNKIGEFFRYLFSQIS